MRLTSNSIIPGFAGELLKAAYETIPCARGEGFEFQDFRACEHMGNHRRLDRRRYRFPPFAKRFLNYAEHAFGDLQFCQGFARRAAGSAFVVNAGVCRTRALGAARGRAGHGPAPLTSPEPPT